MWGVFYKCRFLEFFWFILIFEWGLEICILIRILGDFDENGNYIEDFR